MATEEQGLRPSFYALRPGGWRDLVTILHLPYTGWLLGQVAIAAAVAPVMHVERLIATLGAFFLAVGVSAHALDELQGRPLGTRLSDRTLKILAIVGLAGALAIGAAGVLSVSVTLAPLMLAGAFLVVAYNLELFGGRFHTDVWFFLAWGAFPAAVSYWVNALTIEIPGIAAVLACVWLSIAQRRLSTPVRQLRRKTLAISGEQVLADGSVVALTAAGIAAPLDAALRALSIAVVLLGAALTAVRL